MNARLLGLTALLLASCRTPPPPCAPELMALERTHAARLHGFSQNDDVWETLERLQSAAACARDAQVQQVVAHARLLHWRLGVRGAADQVLALGRMLEQAPSTPLREEGARLRGEVQHAVAARKRLEAHAQRLQQEAATPTEKQRAQLAAEAWLQQRPDPPPERTTSIITHVSDVESCVMVLVGKDAPPGVALIAIRRGAVSLPLHGDSQAVQIPTTPTRPIRSRVCTGVPLEAGDTLRVTVNGRAFHEETLQPTQEAWARGAAILSLRPEGAAPPACSSPSTLHGKTACGWLTGGTP